MIKIEKNVKMPITKKDGLIALSQLKIEESIFVDRDPTTIRIWIRDLVNIAKNEAENIYGLKLNAGHRTVKFIVRREGERVRVWRRE